MDHSKLNHGVLGTPRKDAASSSPTTIASAAPTPTSGDPNVTGMDHSKLNHGVLGGVETVGWKSPK